ncbi:hypothetical protein BDV06DRAFT_210930 [Aspergillus oleicola]
MPPKSATPKTILITGCSENSLGAALALTLASTPPSSSTAGSKHHIFATARDPTKIPESLLSLPNVTTLALDVTSPTSIASAVQTVTDSERGLDILINNAGIGYTIPLLDANIDTAKNVYETNVWGVLRVVQGFADLLVKSAGRVVNVRIYSSSKSSLNQVTETLRLELSPLGVSVLTLMLGTVTTSFHDNEPLVSLPDSSRYTAIRDTISRWAKGEAGPKGCSVGEAAGLITSDVLGAQGVVWRGPNAAAVRWLAKWCPGGWLDSMMRNGQGLDELEKSVKQT